MIATWLRRLTRRCITEPGRRQRVEPSMTEQDDEPQVDEAQVDEAQVDEPQVDEEPAPAAAPAAATGRFTYLVAGVVVGLVLGFVMFKGMQQPPASVTEVDVEPPASATCPACPSAAPVTAPRPASSVACPKCPACPGVNTTKDMGTLLVHGPDIADVVVEGEVVGGVDTLLEVKCGKAEVSLRIGAHAASAIQKVDIDCEGLTEITIAHEPPQ